MDPRSLSYWLPAKGQECSQNCQKCCAQANGRPLIEYVLDALREAGVGKIVVVVGYEADAVKQALGGYENP